MISQPYRDGYGYQDAVVMDRSSRSSRRWWLAALALGSVAALSLVLLIGTKTKSTDSSTDSSTGAKAGEGAAVALAANQGRADRDAGSPSTGSDAMPTPAFDAATASRDDGHPIEGAAVEQPVVEPELATLSVSSTPDGASVMLDGVTIGVTPLEHYLASTGEKLRLQLTLDGYRSESRTIQIEAGAVARLAVALKERTKMGEIDLFVKPWAQVYLGSRKIGEAPARALSLPYGTHRLRLVNPVSGQEKTVTVKVPSTHPYRFTLDP